MTRPFSSQDIPSQVQQSELGIQSSKFVLDVRPPSNVRLLFSWSNRDSWSSRHWQETTSKSRLSNNIEQKGVKKSKETSRGFLIGSLRKKTSNMGRVESQRVDEIII